MVSSPYSRLAGVQEVAHKVRSRYAHLEVAAIRFLAVVVFVVRQSIRSSEGLHCTVEADFADSKGRCRAADKWADLAAEDQEEGPSTQSLQ